MEATPSDKRRGDVLGWTALAVVGTFVLLWAELFLTADADDPNTWEGVFFDTAVLAAASALALGVVLWGMGDPTRRTRAAIIALVLTVLGAVLFWTGAATVLGVATMLLARPDRRVIAVIGGFLAAAAAIFLVVETVVSFAPGVPA